MGLFKKRKNIVILGDVMSGKTHLLRRLQNKPYDPVKEGGTGPGIPFRSFKVDLPSDSGKHHFVLRIRKGIDRGGSDTYANQSMVTDIRRSDIVIYLVHLTDYCVKPRVQARVNDDLQTIWIEKKNKKVIVLLTFANDFKDKNTEQIDIIRRQHSLDCFTQHLASAEWRDVVKGEDILLVDTQNATDHYRVIERIQAK